MKKSTIDWAPFIPEDWEEKRIKDISHLQSGNGITSDDIDEIGLYPVYGGNGLRGYTDAYTNEGSYVLIGRQGALCGNINYAKDKFFASEHAVVVYPYFKDENTTWLGETLRAANLNRLSASAAQPGLAVSALNFVMIPYPPKSQRERIGKYLEEKIPLIDTQVELLKKKRDAYTRLKKAMINRSVTRGLDEHVKFKDSGVEWIGMIPENWEVKRIKDISYMYSGLSGKSGDDFRCDDESITKCYIPFTNVLNNTVIDTNHFMRVVMSDEEKQNAVKENDIIFLMSSEDYESIAKSAVIIGAPGEVYLNSFCRGVRITSKSVYSPFVNYQLNSEVYRDALRFEARGFTRINIKTDRITGHFISLPPFEEQQKIAAYLDEKCAKIDVTIANIDKQTDALKRLKRSLINEVITGQRAV
jgi:type I restriction enzyme S subunit